MEDPFRGSVKSAGPGRRRARRGQAGRMADPRLFRMRRPRATWPSSSGLAAATARRAAGRRRLGDDEPGGLQPIRAGRFFVHTPMHTRAAGHVNVRDRRRPRLWDRPARDHGRLPRGARPAGARGRAVRQYRRHRHRHGLLAFAALALWPEAKCIATDIDPIAIDVTRDNAAINGVKLGHGAGELLLGVADGMDSPLLAARAVRPDHRQHPRRAADRACARLRQGARAGGTMILAGLLDTQADAVVRAYEALGSSYATGARANGRCWSSFRRGAGLRGNQALALELIPEGRRHGRGQQRPRCMRPDDERYCNVGLVENCIAAVAGRRHAVGHGRGGALGDRFGGIPAPASTMLSGDRSTER